MNAVPWPLPALLAWCACWSVFVAIQRVDGTTAAAATAASLTGVALATLAATPWRRTFVAAGFPVSLAVSGFAGSVPAWLWLAPLAALLLFYPLRAWRDAPLFPTPSGALHGLVPLLALPERARVLDAGCGVGSALVELQRELPRATLTGIEFSGPIAWLCALRCRFATVHHGDMWCSDWSPFDLVYLFQRPESMERAAGKAARELRPGSWLASLEFQVPSLHPTGSLVCGDARRLWLYRAPFRLAASGRLTVMNNEPSTMADAPQVPARR